LKVVNEEKLQKKIMQRIYSHKVMLQRLDELNKSRKKLFHEKCWIKKEKKLYLELRDLYIVNWIYW
jgi:hypothetical protein